MPIAFSPPTYPSRVGWILHKYFNFPVPPVAGRFNPRRKIYLRPLVFCLLAFTLMVVFFVAIDADDLMYHHVRSIIHNERHTGNSIRLDDYVLAAAYRLPYVALNLSGITFSPQSRTLFAITNNPPKVYNLDPAGNCLREVALIGFEDTEGISYIDGYRFAIIEERNHTIAIVEIDDHTTVIDRSKVINFLKVDMKGRDNKGFEGVAFDEAMQCIYVVNEKIPRQLLTIEGLSARAMTLQIALNPDLIPRRFFLKDLSGLHFDPATRNLLLVSDESKMISEVSLDGKRVSFMGLEKGSAGLAHDIPQAEGVAMDDVGNIYVVSEPNFFYRFARKGEAAPGPPIRSCQSGDTSTVPAASPPEQTVLPNPMPSSPLTGASAPRQKAPFV